MIKPKALRKNATIGIVSPASPMRDEQKLHKGIRYLESLGYHVKLGGNVLKRVDYLAGTDKERMCDIEEMFADKMVDAIFCSRGGYGTMRILESLNYSVIRRNPKIFVGFSDATALQCAIWQRCKLVTFSGAMVGVDMDNFDSESEESFWRSMTSTKKLGRIKQSIHIQNIHKGKAHGHLICGNLTLLAALCGSRFQPDYRKAILLSEEVGEESYRVDRLLSQLELSGVLMKCSALAFGQFTCDISRKTTTPKRDVAEILKEYAMRSSKPSVGNIMYGHTAKKLTLPLGVMCSIEASRKTFSVDEAGVI